MRRSRVRRTISAGVRDLGLNKPFMIDLRRPPSDSPIEGRKQWQKILNRSLGVENEGEAPPGDARESRISDSSSVSLFLSPRVMIESVDWPHRHLKEQVAPKRKNEKKKEKKMKKEKWKKER